jgi:hypothetical protein
MIFFAKAGPKSRVAFVKGIAPPQLYESLSNKLQKANARAILARTSRVSATSDNTAVASISQSVAALMLSADAETRR